MKYRIWGSAGNQLGERDEIIEANSDKEAMDHAFHLALKEREMYEGLHSVRSVSEIEEVEEVDEEEAVRIYYEEAENEIEFGIDRINKDD